MIAQLVGADAVRARMYISDAMRVHMELMQCDAHMYDMCVYVCVCASCVDLHCRIAVYMCEVLFLLVQLENTGVHRMTV